MWRFHSKGPSAGSSRGHSPSRSGSPSRSKRPTQHASPGVRLCHVNPPTEGESETETDIDIIAIHGLDTKSPDTWIWKRDPRNHDDLGVNWLADKDMLPSMVGRARIFTCDWPASLFETTEVAENTFEELARLLLEGIKARDSTSSDCAREDRPILFIASCLGGIILTKALVMANGGQHIDIARATCGIVFLATPFHGTSFKNVAKWAEPGLERWASVRNLRVTSRLTLAKGPNDQVSEIIHSFTALCNTNEYYVSTFYEKEYTNLYRKVPCLSPLLPRQKKQLVNQASASLTAGKVSYDPLPLTRTHVMMNKFSGGEADSDYLLVSNRIRDILQKVREGSPLQRADDWIRKKHYTKERLKIQRLLGELLPMEQCYINLTIVSRLGEKMSGADAASSPFSLRARLKVEIPSKNLLIQLPTLFNARKLSNGQMREPRRILIRGRAGVGKTTLCKKIVYDFIHGHMWAKRFTRILWLPLRKLKELGDSKNLGAICEHVYLRDNPDGLELSQALWQDLGQSDGSATLFLLDGLDEVSELLDPGHQNHALLQELCDKPNVIITTRPHTIFPHNFSKPDLEVETVGFHPDQVQKYLEIVVQNRHKITELQQFLQKHQLLQSLVRIPIQLDAFCLTWDENLKGTIPETMTDVYNAIVNRLWEKDISRLGRRSEYSVMQALPDEIALDIDPERKILECLAFGGMYNNEIEFQPEHRNAILRLVKLPDQRLTLDQRLTAISFLRTSDASVNVSRRSYHFLHLTFQEFFAAQYFARQWKSDEDLECHDFKTGRTTRVKPYSFLQRHKYDVRYDIMWRFVTGEVEGREGIPSFFNAIEQEPLDLLGPTHQRLIMHCLTEVHKNLPVRKILDKKLSQWLLFEISLRGSADLVQESDFPDGSLHIALNIASSDEKKKILGAMRWVDKSSSNKIVKALVEMLTDEDGDVQSEAAYALAAQLSLPEFAVSALVKSLIDGKVSFKYSPRSYELVAFALIKLLTDENHDVRHEVAAILKYRIELSDTTVAALIKLLANPDSDVRSCANHVLESQSSLQGSAVFTFISLLTSEDDKLRDCATDTVKRHLDSPNLTNTDLLKLIVDQYVERQSYLTDIASLSLTDLITERNAKLRRNTVTALNFGYGLPSSCLTAFIHLLKDKDRVVRDHVAEIFEKRKYHNWPSLSEPIVQTLTNLLQDENWSVRYTAAEALGEQSLLPAPTVIALTSSLQDEHWVVRRDAAEALGKQSLLPAPTVIALTSLLQDEHEFVRIAAAGALGEQSLLPAPTVIALTNLLQDEHGSVRYVVVNSLEKHSLLPEAVLSFINLLGDQDREVRFRALNTLGYNSNLQDRILDTLGFSPISGGSPESSHSSLLNSQTMASFYGAFLVCAFKEQFCLYSDKGRNSWIIHRANGRREARSETEEIFNDVLEGIEKGRQMWNPKGYKVWE